MSVAFGTAMALGMIWSSAVAAQETFSESHLEAAKSVTIASKALEPFDAILPLLAEQTTNAFVQADPMRAEEAVAVTQEVALQLAPKRAELNAQLYKLWAARFTEEELLQLAEFYNTPLGVKLRDNIPQITGQSLQIAREWQDTLGTEMVAIVREELTKRASEQ
ncbi:DUF2059 domain-containing protein [Roseibium denhamense]|nr:DUF2059 domain-containing protein [Roseibium denhamense]